jgi:hypothetical protein
VRGRHPHTKILGGVDSSVTDQGRQHTKGVRTSGQNSRWNGELPRETIGNIQSVGCLGQREVVITAHNACIRELLREVNVHGRLGTLWVQEECNEFCSMEELWESVRDEEMKILWKGASEGQPPTEEQYQERFWRRRLDSICLDVITKEFLAIEFKRTQDMRGNHLDEITAVAQKQYKSLLMGLQAIGQNKWWKVQQLVFVGGTCGSVHVESFNSNMKALGVLEKVGSHQKEISEMLIGGAGQGASVLFCT